LLRRESSEKALEGALSIFRLREENFPLLGGIFESEELRVE
jgi:hypothetical protein